MLNYHCLAHIHLKIQSSSFQANFFRYADILRDHLNHFKCLHTSFSSSHTFDETINLPTSSKSKENNFVQLLLFFLSLRSRRRREKEKLVEEETLHSRTQQPSLMPCLPFIQPAGENRQRANTRRAQGTSHDAKRSRNASGSASF